MIRFAASFVHRRWEVFEMKKLAIFLATTCAAGAVLLAPARADALGPIGIEAGAKVGVGTNPVSGSTINPLGFGIGARGGISIFNIYAGVAGVYYLGGNNETAGLKTTLHTAVYGFEAGYNIKLLGLLTIRPQVGFGNNEFSGNVSGGGVTSSFPSSGYFYLEPAVVGLFSIGILYVGADVGALLLPAGPANTSAAASCKGAPSSCHSFDAALTAHAQVGVNF
jgi:hypothetical protein